MNKKALGVFVSLLVVAILALPMSSGYATPSMPVNGTITVAMGPDGVVTVEVSGNSDNGICTKSNFTTTWTGDIAGSGSMDVREALKDGGAWKTSTGLYVTDATVDGKSGTLSIKTSVNTRDPQPSKWRIVSGTDDLANLHGQGTFWFVPGVGMVYTGQVHFDP